MTIWMRELGWVDRLFLINQTVDISVVLPRSCSTVGEE